MYITLPLTSNGPSTDRLFWTIVVRDLRFVVVGTGTDTGGAAAAAAAAAAAGAGPRRRTHVGHLRRRRGPHGGYVGVDAAEKGA